MVKVLIVEDSPTAREMISVILATDPDIQVIGKVSNGREAIEFLSKNSEKPDIITTDINMPVMNGFEMIEHLMAYNPIPILILTILNKEANFMRALNLGALDIIEKPAPSAWDQLPKVGMELIEKVKLLSRVKVITHLSGRKRVIQPQGNGANGASNEVASKSDKIICIASSTGGPNTLLKLLKHLPSKFPAPIVIVQHMSEGFFIKGLVEWFQTSVPMNVLLAENDIKLSPGTVYISPIQKHLVFEKGRIRLTDDPPVKNQKPSADKLFESAAEQFGKNVIGVVLTGVGNDGANGVISIRTKGGVVIAQSEENCIVFGMPKAAIETNCVEKILDIDDIAKELLRLV